MPHLTRTATRDPSLDLVGPCTPRRIAQVAWIVGIPALTALTLWGESAGPRQAPFVLDVASGVVACGLVPVLFRRPVVGALVLAVLAALSPAATPAATLGTLQTARQRALAVAAGVAAAGVLAHAARGMWRPASGVSFEWWVVLVILAHAALLGWGALTRARQALITALEERALRAEAEQGRRVAEARASERTRIAREMHDVLAHRLSLLATYAGAMEYRPDASPERLSHAAGVIRTGVHDALGELRDVIAVLRDDEGESGSTDRPQPVLTDVPQLVEESRAAGMHIDVRDRLEDAEKVPPAIGRTAYRIVQEALTNARKHAAGEPVALELGGGPQSGLVLELSNPTSPRLRSSAAIPGAGTGLVGLTERTRLAGGRLDHHLDGERFRLWAWLPWPT